MNGAAPTRWAPYRAALWVHLRRNVVLNLLVLAVLISLILVALFAPEEQFDWFYYYLAALFVAMIAQRLEAQRGYALAFVAPAYRIVQARVALGLIVVLAWGPLLLASPTAVEALARIGYLMMVTGTLLLLMLRGINPVWVVTTGFLVVLAVIFTTDDPGTIARALAWPPLPSALASLLGAVLTGQALRRLAAPREHRDAAAGNDAAAAWLREDFYAMTRSRETSSWSVRARSVPRRIARLRANRASKRARRLALDTGAGPTNEWLLLLLLVLVPVLFVSVMQMSGARLEADIALVGYLVAVLLATSTFAVLGAVEVRWPLHRLWLLPAAASKQELMHGFLCTKLVAVGRIAAVGAVALLGLLLGFGRLELWPETLAAQLAVVLQATALSFAAFHMRRFGLLVTFFGLLTWAGAVFVLLNWASARGILLPVATLSAYVLALLATSIVCLVIAIVAFQHRFYRRLQHSLVPIE